MVEGILLGVLGDILYDGGKAAFASFVGGAPVRKAVNAVASEFPGVPGLSRALGEWCRSGEFATLIESFRVGTLPSVQEAVVDSFVETSKFYDGITNTHRSARRILEAFWRHLEEELYRSGDGALIEAQRGKLRHRETQARLEDIGGLLRELDLGKAPADGPGPLCPRQPWAPLPDFVGRKKEIEELLSKLRGGGRASISGMGGVGKTELALHVAHLLSREYPDAQLFVNMHGTDEQKLDAGNALAACVRSLAGPAYRIPDGLSERAALYHSALSGRRALILLDNVSEETNLRPLLPPPGNALLITSRRALAVPGVERVELKELEGEDARKLLLLLAPRVASDTADVICRLCGNLPLAVRAAGNLLEVTADLNPAAYAARLNDERTRFDEIGDEGVNAGVEASFNLSYQSLQAETARTFRRLSVFPASFDAEAAERVCEDGGHAHLSDLARRGLVQYDPASGRYRMHDLMRVFAGQRLTVEDGNTAERHCAYYMFLLQEANEHFISGGESAMRGLNLFDLEWSNIRAGQAWAAAHAREQRGAALACSDYPNAGANLLHLRLPARDYLSWLEAAVSAARIVGISEVEGKNLFHLGNAYDDLSDPHRAVMCYEQALDIFRKAHYRRGEAGALHGLASQYEHLGQTARAIQIYEQALRLAREEGDPSQEAAVLGNLGNAYLSLDDPGSALNFYQQALTLVSGRDRRTEGNMLANLGNFQARYGEPHSARVLYEHSLSIFRELGDLRGEAEVLGSLGAFYDAILGETGRAVECYEQRLNLARELEDRRGEAVTLFNLSLAVAKLGDRQRALRHAEAALAIFEQIDDRRAAVVRKRLTRWHRNVWQ